MFPLLLFAATIIFLAWALSIHSSVRVQMICSASTSSGDLPYMTISKRANDLATLLRNRRSVRTYQDRPVERMLLEQMLEAARWAPSPHGRQPWRFAVLTQQEPKQRLAEQMGEIWRTNLQMDGQSEEIVTLRLAKSHQRILQAPAIIIPCLYL